MTSLQKEVAGLLLSDTQPERVFSNKVLPSIAEIIAHSNGNEDLNDAYYLIASNCIDHLACNGVDDKDKEELLDTLKTEAEQAKYSSTPELDAVLNSKENEQKFVKKVLSFIPKYSLEVNDFGKLYVNNSQVDLFTKEVRIACIEVYKTKPNTIKRVYDKVVSILSSSEFCFSKDWLTNAFQEAFFYHHN